MTPALLPVRVHTWPGLLAPETALALQEVQGEVPVPQELGGFIREIEQLKGQAHD